MKKLLFLFLSFVCFSSFVKADTLDYWQVYYNQVKVVELNSIDKKEEMTVNVTDKHSIYFLFDYLFIHYFNDTPCSECESFVFVENMQGQIITKSSSKGTFTPIKISMSDIVQYYQKTKHKYYDIFYIEKNDYGKSEKTLLFRLKLE